MSRMKKYCGEKTEKWVGEWTLVICCFQNCMVNTILDFKNKNLNKFFL